MSTELSELSICWKPLLDLLEKQELNRGSKELSIEERNEIALELETSLIHHVKLDKTLERANGLTWSNEILYLFVPIIAIAALSKARIKDTTKELVLVNKKR